MRAVFVVLLLLSRVAWAQQHDVEARAAYSDGKLAYQAGHYEVALEQFKKSYTLCGEPALLYNVAAALQNLNRPGEAADTLQEFVKLRPSDSERAELEKRISNLRRAQQLVERDNEHRRRLEEEEAQRRAHDLEVARQTGWLSEVDLERRVLLLKDRERDKRKKLAIGLSVGLGALTVGGIAVAIVCGLGHCTGGEPKDWDFGRATVTP